MLITNLRNIIKNSLNKLFFNNKKNPFIKIVYFIIILSSHLFNDIYFTNDVFLIAPI